MSDEVGVRADLLRAAREELGDQGHAGVSLRAVARRAGVSHAAPKHHFDTRAGLLSAVATAGFDELAADLDAAVEGVDHTADRLARLGAAYVAFAEREPALFDLMFRSSELDPDHEPLQRAGAAALARLAAVVDGPDVVGGSDTDPDARWRRVLTAWSLVHGLAVIRRQVRAERSVEADDVALLLQDFAAGMTARWR